MARRKRSKAGKVTAVALDGLEKCYGETRALGPLDLKIEAGESLAIVGHNGSGKSTLLALVSGVLDPSEGEVRVFGEEPGSMPARAAISYLPDAPVLYDDLSVREHLEYVSRLHGADGDEPLLDELIERLGLEARQDELPSQFSRGLRQKTAIAVGLCRPFTVLLIDEPFVGLDAEGKQSLVDLLAEASEDGATIVVATHEPLLVERLARCLVLSEGELAYDGPTGEVPEAHLPAGGPPG
ncbi:MAG: ABC transporter ATP-binding protein [Actinobacteria bacterium]|nr:MAG: ABC transporter ATP-binding protein [Actinomycetota bacterium]RIK06738.1 MAG: ABC transporter [Acidobacteriota bacterium]